MIAPLPSSIAALSQCPLTAHTGLWFDKYCNQWSTDWKLDSSAKLKWIQTVTGKAVGDEKLLTEHTSRLNTLAKCCGGQAIFFKTLGRFTTGLGREHPIENGFVWHPTLGVPYLPGSSVKGLVRAWTSMWIDAGKEAVTRIFGPSQESRSSNIGSVLFFDAIPTEPIQLAADVMTPHYGPYYEDKSGQTAPGDWHSPVPIPFLTVAEGQKFLFALAPRTLSEDDRKDYESAVKWLTDALLELGAGAKTAVGYGRFVKSIPGEKPVEKAIPKRPRYAINQRVLVKRIEDPKGKGRVWFQADDSFGGVVTSGILPQVEMGQSTELEIAAVHGTGYNFRLPGIPTTPAKTNSPPHRQ